MANNTHSDTSILTCLGGQNQQGIVSKFTAVERPPPRQNSNYGKYFGSFQYMPKAARRRMGIGDPIVRVGTTHIIQHLFWARNLRPL